MALEAVLAKVQGEPSFWAGLVSAASGEFCQQLGQNLCTMVAGDSEAQEFVAKCAEDHLRHLSQDQANRRSKRPAYWDATASATKRLHTDDIERCRQHGVPYPQAQIPFGIPVGCMHRVLSMLSYNEKVCVISITCRTLLRALQDNAAWKKVVVTEKSDAKDFVARLAATFYRNKSLTLICGVADSNHTLGHDRSWHRGMLHIPVVLSEWTTDEQVHALCGLSVVVDKDNLLGERPFEASEVCNCLVLMQSGISTFADKVKQAASVGARGIIVFDNKSGKPSFPMISSKLHGTPTLPAVLTTEGKGNALSELASLGVVYLQRVAFDFVSFQQHLLTSSMRSATSLKLELMDNWSGLSDSLTFCSGFVNSLRKMSGSCDHIDITVHSDIWSERVKAGVAFAPLYKTYKTWDFIIILRTAYVSFAHATLEMQLESPQESIAMRIVARKGIPAQIMTQDEALVENRRRCEEANSDRIAVQEIHKHELLLLSECPCLWLARGQVEFQRRAMVHNVELKGLKVQDYKIFAEKFFKVHAGLFT